MNISNLKFNKKLFTDTSTLPNLFFHFEKKNTYIYIYIHTSPYLMEEYKARNNQDNFEEHSWGIYQVSRHKVIDSTALVQG